MLRVAAVTAAALSAFLVSCFSKPGEPHATRSDAITDGVMPSGNSVIVFHSPDGSAWTQLTAANGTEAHFDNFNVKTCG